MFDFIIGGLWTVLFTVLKLAVLGGIAAVIFRFALFVFRKMWGCLKPAVEQTRKMFTGNGK